MVQTEKGNQTLTIRIKRAYDPPAAEDGIRVLVDRLWPRGLTKEKLQLAAWLKEVAPSNALRQQVHHDPAHGDQFVAAYHQELAANPLAVQTLLEYARQDTLTLIYGARDTVHNQAVVLKQYLEKYL
ncbi:MAG: DUF488 domain-containing protein [Bellilinea sp.]